MKPVLLALFFCCVTIGAHAQVNALPQARHVLVYGEAQARAIPDRFRIQITFTATEPNVDTARQRVEKNLQDAIARLKEASVPAGEIVATSLRIDPDNEYNQQQQRQVFKGMRVTRTLSARFADQAALKRFLSQLTTSEEIQVSGITAELGSEPALRRQLRQKAIASTREKADVIAKAYNVRLAGLYSVSDTAPQISYGISEGSWPAIYQWNYRGGTLDRIEVTGTRTGDTPSAMDAPAPAPASESFQTGYVDFTDRIYAVFLITD